MKNIRKFLINVFSISTIVAIIIGAGFFCTIDRASAAFSLRHKHGLLQEVEGPRIVFVGGSNLRFGLISQMVRDSLNMNTVNTGLLAGFGLKFIIDDITRYLKKGDIVALASEYHQFYGNAIWGTRQLAQAINICPETIQFLNWRQVGVLVKALPGNNLGKLKATFKQAAFGTSPNIRPYERYDGMNHDGETIAHWTEPSELWVPDTLSGNFNGEAIRIIKELNNYVTGPLQGKLLITFPPYPECGYDVNRVAISRVENELKQQGVPLLGAAENYVFADSLFFNSSYHLGKDGAILRTNEFINNMRYYLKSISSLEP
ncbi:MAG TPA: hypothetical protein PK339_11275 [Flavitalea sp.]|nr:hypothetical protein [Flavitalea sp.]